MINVSELRRRPEEIYARGQPFLTLASYGGMPKLVQLVHELEPNYRTASAIEFGPGDDLLALQAGFRHRTYVDISPVAAEKIRTRLDTGGHVRVGRLEDLSSFRNNEFDVAIVNEVLPHVEKSDHERVLQELGRIANKIIITNMCMPSDTSDEVYQLLDKLPEQQGAVRGVVNPRAIERHMSQGFRTRISFAGIQVPRGNNKVHWWEQEENPPKVGRLAYHYFVLLADKKNPSS